MIVNQYDEVILKDGRTATIVEILEDGIEYLADVNIGDDEWDTIEISHQDINEVI